jgi:arylsulfatase A-like enzyme
VNVLLVILDSVRARNTSLHGYQNETTPFLETFAEDATTYTQARSPGSWSLPSHTSIFTGLHVAEHGVTQAQYKLAPDNTIFEYLATDHGYETGIFSENTWVTEMDVGLKESFETVEGARNLPYTEGLDPSNFVLSEGQGQYVAYLKRCLSHDQPFKSIANGVVTKLAWDYPQYLPDRFTVSTEASVYTDLFLDWIDHTDDEWAACINFMDGHLPYEPRDEHDKWGGRELTRLQNSMEDQVWEFLGGQRPWWQRRALEGLYDGTIHQMDAQVFRLVDGLRERGLYDDTLVVVTADHGEGFGEPSTVKRGTRLAGHGKDVHESLLHVPLVVKHPGQEEGAVVEEPATLTRFPDVVRGALDGDRIGFVPEAGLVVASSHGLDEPSIALAEEYCGRTEPYDGDSMAVYEAAADSDGVVKYEAWADESSTVRLFGAGTAHKTADTDGGRVAEVFDAFEDAGVRGESGGLDEVNEATRERLENLGYV